MEERTQQIRARVEAGELVPLEVDENDPVWQLVKSVLAERDSLRAQLAAQVIANEVVKAERDSLREDWITTGKWAEKMNVENHRLRKALEHYADDENWREDVADLVKGRIEWVYAPAQNATNIARAALAVTETPRCPKCGDKGYLVDSVHNEPWCYCDCPASDALAEAELRGDDKAMRGVSERQEGE